MSPKRLLRIVRQRIRAIWRPASLDAELDRELAFHLEQLTEELIADGMTPEEARFAAKRAMGNLPLIAEQSRDRRGVAWLSDFQRDLFSGFRMLLRTPVSACVIAASLAIGIGANTVVLGAIDAVFRSALPIPEPETVVRVATYHDREPRASRPATFADYTAWSEQNRSFEAINLTLRRELAVSDLAGGNAERVVGVATTAATFDVLRVPAALGRVFTAADVPAAGPGLPVVIGHGLWLRRFGGSPDVAGTRFLLNRREVYVIGVMPDGFAYPQPELEFWAAIPANPGDVQSPERVYGVTARLKPGVTLEQAEADLNAIEDRLARQRPDRHGGWHVQIVPIRDAMYRWTLEPLWTLEAAVALVLLVACTNIAGLLLARAVTRRSEISLRSALGASRGRLVRQLMAEAIAPAAIGGALGVGLAAIGAGALQMLVPPPGAMPLMTITIDTRMVVLAITMSAVSACVFGVVPSVAASRWPLSEARAGRWREVLVTAQIAVTLVLLIGAALLTRSFVAVITRDVRFDPERLLAFDVNVPINEFMLASGAVGDRPYFEIGPVPSALFQRLHDEFGGLPDVRGVAGTSVSLVNSLIVPTRTVEASGGAGRDPIDMAWFLVTPDFLTTLKVRVIRGRDISRQDTTSSPWVAVVNETAAHYLWPGADPIGRQLRLTDVPDERPRQVIALVPDVPLAIPQERATPAIYLPYLQQPDRYPLPGANRLGQMTFMIRTAGEPRMLVPAVQQALHRVDARRTITNVTTMQEQLRSRFPERARFLIVIGMFAGAATLLAAIGIYGIVSYTAALRTREIGVRIALGATEADVVGLVSRRAAILAGGGLVAGLAGAVVATRLLRRQLFEVTSTDPLTYAAALLLLTAVCVAACAVPTRRAMRLDPTIALRCE